MKAQKSKTTSSNLQLQQDTKPSSGRDGESMFFSEATHEVQTKPFFTADQNISGNYLQNSKPFFSPATIQAKLSIGQPNDKYEQEADAMADQVVQRMAESAATPDVQASCAPCEQEEKIQQKEELEETDKDIQEKPIFESEAEPEVQAKVEPPAVAASEAMAASPVALTTSNTIESPAQKEELEQEVEEGNGENELQRKPAFDTAEDPPEDDIQPTIATDSSIQRACADCEQKEEVKNAPPSLQTKSENDGNTVSPDLQSRLESSKGSGQSLPLQTQTSMEYAMEADFSNVRVHTGSESIQMNRELGAQAFTHGSDIHFNKGKYDTDSNEGKKLLAHELTHTVQQRAASKSIQKKPQDHQHTEDGDQVEQRMKEKAKEEADGDVDFTKGKGQLTEEERAQANNPDLSEKNSQKAEIKNEGTAKPDVNRPAEEKPKVEEASEEGKANLEEDPEQKGEKKKEEKKPRADLAASEAKEQSALMAVQAAEQVQIPEKRAPFTAPNFSKPVDSDTQEVPGRADLTKLARGLYEIIKALASSAFQLIYQAAVDSKEAWHMRGKLDESWSKTRRVKAGSTVMKADKASREAVNVKEEEALTKVEADTTMVKTEAPNIIQESAKAKEESGGLVEETQENQKKMEDEKPDDPDAAKDAEKQSEDTQQAAEGAETTDSAIKGTGDCAENYLKDAVEGEQKNQQTKVKLEENKGILEQTGQEIARIDIHNAQSETQLGTLDHYPELVQEQTAARAQSGEELYAIAKNANQELVNIQEEYLNSMASLPKKEDAQAELDAKQAEENPPEEQALSPEEELLLQMSNMGEAELDAMLMTMDEEELEGLNTTLNGMETEEEQEQKSIVGEADASGRSQVDLMQLFDSGDGEAPKKDPRQDQIDAIEGTRESRLKGVKQTVDANFTYLSAEQKVMLSQKLAMQDAVEGLFSIDTLVGMSKGMIMGMINPVESLKGVIDGASKMATGVYNLFCADAWRKDPLGTLLQSAADIATGLTTIFMSITGAATAITILSVAAIIASWGALAGPLAPLIGWMATVISTVGGWTIVTGLIALALNALTYIKNLHDAGVAENTNQLLAESGQLKQNMTDGFTSAMAVVGGKGDKAGATKMKGKINAAKTKAGPGGKWTKEFAGDLKGSFKGGVNKMGNFGKGLTKWTKSMTQKGVAKVKGGIQKAIQKVRGGVTKGVDDVKGGVTNLKNKLKGKGKVKTPKDGNLGNVGGKKVKAELEVGSHKVKSLEGGQCAICSNCKPIRGKFGEEFKTKRGKELDTELKRLENDLRAAPTNKNLLLEQKRIHDELVDIQSQRIGPKVKEMETRIKNGDRSITKQEYKDYHRNKRMLDDNTAHVKKRYDVTNPKGGFDLKRIRQELEAGKKFLKKKFGLGKRKKRSGDSQRLKSNINDPYNPKHFQAHHIIPIQVFDDLNDFFKKIDFDIDDAKNGILLPPNPNKLSKKARLEFEADLKAKGVPDDYLKRSTHHGSHKNYTDRVRTDINRIAKLSKGMKNLDDATKGYFKTQIQGVIDKYKAGLADGSIKLNSI